MSFTSPFPNVEIPRCECVRLPVRVDRRRGPRADRPGGPEIGYDDHVRSAPRPDRGRGRRARVARDRGGRGDVVGILSPNIPAFATVFHGILRAGATATTINALFTASEIAKQLRDSGAKMLVTISPMFEQAKAAADEVGLSAENLIVLDGEGGQEASGHPQRDRSARPQPSGPRTSPSTRRPMSPSSRTARERRETRRGWRCLTATWWPTSRSSGRCRA